MIYPVHLLDTPEPEDLQTLRSLLEENIQLTTGQTLPYLAEFRLLVAGRPGAAELDASPFLERLVIPFAGLPPKTRELLLEHPHIKVHNLHHNAALTAEMAMALLLSAAKYIIPYDRSLRQGDWSLRYQPNPSVLLEGKTALILGFGEIGRRIARACWGLGLQVIAVRRQLGMPVPELQFPIGIHTVQELPELLPRADILVIALPATPETDGLLSARELDLLPENSIVVNVGRGAVIEQHALYERLRNNKIAAAGLDVWYNYPPDETSRSHTVPADIPFHELENIVMSPHRAGLARDTETLRMTALAQLINAAARGDNVPGQVDVERGY